MGYGDRTTCKACGREIIQIGGGHRLRLYCDDNCKQAAFRERREQEHRDAINRRWSSFTPETRGFLDWLSTRYSYGEDLATNVEHAINRELERITQQLSAQRDNFAAYYAHREALGEKQLKQIDKLKARISLLEQQREQS